MEIRDAIEGTHARVDRDDALACATNTLSM
jgi:hypothetical protein